MNRTLISLLFDTLQSPAYSAVKGQEVHTFNTIHIKYYTLGFLIRIIQYLNYADSRIMHNSCINGCVNLLHETYTYKNIGS